MLVSFGRVLRYSSSAYFAAIRFVVASGSRPKFTSRGRAGLLPQAVKGWGGFGAELVEYYELWWAGLNGWVLAAISVGATSISHKVEVWNGGSPYT